MKYLTAIIAVFFALYLHHDVKGQIMVSGTVISDESGEALPGVTVVIEGTLIGTVTDSDGAYSIDLRSLEDVLVFSFVGFQTQRYTMVPGVATLDVSLQPSVVGLEEVVVVGSRRPPRTVTNSAVPLEVLGPRDLESASSIDMDDILRAQIPSYNVQRHEIDGSTTFVRPPTLRGLSPDNTLLLVNGKRRHRTGSIALFGSSLILGAQGPDMNMIPSIAIRQFELLRDGASAQYGADAVAGVFNLQLRNNASGVIIRGQAGQYDQGDGEYIRLGANVGLPLTRDGFLNLSLEYRDMAPTVRTVQRADAALLASRGYPVANPAQIWGNPDIDHGVVGFFNAGIDLDESAHAYAFGGFGRHSGNGSYYFRAPGTPGARANVFRFGSGETATRAIADLNMGDNIDCRNLPDLPGLDSDFSAVEGFVRTYQGDCFLFNEKFPGGFNPRFGADISDLSLTTGLRGVRENGLQWDVSVGAGRSLLDYFIRNTVNASYGPDTPTSFRQRDFVQEEITADLALSYPLEVSFLFSPLNVAWGTQWRTEIFETKPGDLYSYNPGPFASQGFSVGSNGDQGIPPNFSGRWHRPNYALYVDLEADVTKKLLLGVAARYENFYNSFGSTITGKMVGLWRVLDWAGVRGSVSTGFRAPSPGQAHLQNVQTNFSGDGGLIDAGQLPSTHPIAQALGGKTLTEETARSYSVGVVFEFTSDLNLTVDYFDIKLNNRIALTGGIPLTGEMVEIINRQGLLKGFETLREIKFFSNDFDTRTQGIDLVLSWDREWEAGNATVSSIAWNWTQPKLVDFSVPKQVTEFLGVSVRDPVTISILTPRRRIEIEDVNPHHRIVFSTRQVMGPIHGLLRLNYYDGWKACLFFDFSCTVGGDSGLEEYDGQWIVDLEAGYRLMEDYRFAVGVNNVFATAPDAHPIEVAGQGNLHPASTPWDYNGAAIYIRLTADLF